MFSIDPDEGLSSFISRVLDTAALTVPELAGPAYIVGMELPGMRGVHIPGLDRVFRREIEAAGKWRGQGPAAAVDQEQIYQRAFAAARAAGLDEQRSDFEARRQIAACVIHELSHAIERADDRGDDLLSNGPEIARKAVDMFLHDQPLPDPFTVAAPSVPWKGHALNYIRCCGIIFSRLVPELPLRFWDVCETAVYGLSPARTYARAMQIDGDFSHSEDTPIRDILETPPGDILRAKWRQDIFSWFAKSDRSDEATQAAEQALSLSNGRSPTKATARAATAKASPAVARTRFGHAIPGREYDAYLPEADEHFAETWPTLDAWQLDSFISVDVADGVRRMDARLRFGLNNELQPACFFFADDTFTPTEAQTWLDRRGIVYVRLTPSKNSLHPQLTA